MSAAPITTTQANPADFIGLLHQLLAGIVRADRPFIKNMRQFLVRSRRLQAKEATPPLQPLEDERIAYGYLMALADVAHVAERTVVPYEIITLLLRNSEARDVLLCLAKAPVGVLSQKDLTDKLHRSQPNISRAMKKLAQHGLIRQEDRGGSENPKVAVSITAEGRAAARVIEGGGTSDESLDQEEQSFSVLIENALSPNDLVRKVYNIAAQADDPERVGVLFYDALEAWEPKTRISLPAILLALNCEVNKEEEKIASKLLNGMIQGGLEAPIFQESLNCAVRYSSMGLEGWSGIVSKHQRPWLQRSINLVAGTAR